MSKIVKVTHALGTIKVHPSGGGQDIKEIEGLIAKRLEDGYTEIIVTPIRSNFTTDGALTDVVNLYTFIEREQVVGEGSSEVKPRAKKVKDVA